MFSNAVLFVSLAATLAHGLPVQKLKYEFDHYVFTQRYPAGCCYSYKAQVCIDCIASASASSH